MLHFHIDNLADMALRGIHILLLTQHEALIHGQLGSKDLTFSLLQELSEQVFDLSKSIASGLEQSEDRDEVFKKMEDAIAWNAG